MMATVSEIDAMRLAIALSANGLGTTSPNPPVGCVVLDTRGQIVGTGYHRRKGEPHAEGHALRAAGDRAVGGTAVVTLEPCNHVGRTPACRQLLLDAGISRVVIALIDPTSRGDGGAAVLRAHGVDVEVGLLADEARLVLGSWLDANASQRPHVTAAYMAGDNANEIPGPVLARWRRRFDAVIDDRGCVTEGVLNSHGPGTLTLPADPVADDVHAQVNRLYLAGVRLLLVAGPTLAHTYLAAGLADRAVVLAPQPQPHTSTAWTNLTPHGLRLANVTTEDEYLRLEFG